MKLPVKFRLTGNNTKFIQANMLRFFLLTVALATVKASHYSSGGHGLEVRPKFLSQSVHLQEIPTKVIRITKTVAIKVPVPYPVKVPYHIPVPVPVNHPVAVPVPQIVKVPHHIPYEVSKAVPYELHQQVPILVSKPVPFPQPVPVPHPVAINRPVFYPVPHAVPYPQYSESTGYTEGGNGGGVEESNGHDHGQNYDSYTVESHGQDYGHGNDGGHGNENFQPSQQDYSVQH